MGPIFHSWLLITKSSKKSCPQDPMATSMVCNCLDILLLVLTRMINLSLQSGCFPDSWKHATIQPRLKKSNAEHTFSNLRPISSLTFVSKLAERAVVNQIHDYFTTHNLYPKAQSSYGAPKQHFLK